MSEQLFHATACTCTQHAFFSGLLFRSNELERTNTLVHRDADNYTKTRCTYVVHNVCTYMLNTSELENFLHNNEHNTISF